MVLVSNYGIGWFERGLLHTFDESISQRYVCRNTMDQSRVNCWKFMKPIPQLKDITPEELAEMGYKLKGV